MIWSQKKYNVPAAPNYAALTGKDVFDSTGMVYNTANSYGTVNVGGWVTLWKSIINASKTFALVDVKGAGNMIHDRVKNTRIILDRGAGVLRQASAVQSRTDFGYLWFNAGGYSAMRWTIHCVVKCGMENFYGSLLAILGCNQGGDPTKPGILMYQADRLAASQDDTFSCIISKATAGYINNSTTNSVITSGTWHVISVEFDGSLGATNSIKLYVDGVLQTIGNTSSSTTVNTTNVSPLEIMGLGGSALSTTSSLMSHLIIQNVVESASVRNTIIAELGLWRDYFNAPDNGNGERLDGQVTKYIQETRYYLTTKIIQDRVNDNKLCSLFTNGTHAAGNAGKRLSICYSTNYGHSWGAISTVYDPAGTEFVQTSNAGVTDAKKYWCFFTTQDNPSGTTIANPTKLYSTFSTDQGATWSAPVDITASVPSDTLTTWLNESQVICNDGRVGFAIYKQTAPGVTTQSANYFIYSDDDGATWNASTIRAIGTDYINESSMVHLGGDDLYCLIGNYTANEWECYTSADNGDTWTSEGLMNFSPAVDTTPSTLHKFQIDGVELVRFNFYHHNSGTYKSAYAKVSEMLINPLTCFPTALQAVTENQAFYHGDFCHYGNGPRCIYFTPCLTDGASVTENNLVYGHALIPSIDLLVSTFGI